MKEESVPLLTEQQKRVTQEGGLTLYREVAVGKQGLGALLWYECITGIGSILPGLAGLGFRSVAYRTLFGECGARPYIGRGVVVRNPSSMCFGHKVLIDDDVILDCRKGSSIEIGDHSCIGRSSIIAAKGGDVRMGDGVNIGTHARIATQSGITIGRGVLIAAYAYIGPSNHEWDDATQSFIAGTMENRGGVMIGERSWIGARATILDGVSIGEGAVVGAHSLVRENVPAKTVVAGCPARVIGKVSE
ncbi:MAG: acyltransferase [Bdellovibrionota bacterium]|jgi:acetyltransferase-like isoleucine patch superfamily enzyme